MKLNISKDRYIRDVQQDFNVQYPFLKIDFYKLLEMKSPVKKHFPDSILLKDAGLKKDGTLKINGETTVKELEKSLSLNFGLNAQVSRRSGILWLETTMTDNWTLQKQNDLGREITLGSKKIL